MWKMCIPSCYILLSSWCQGFENLLNFCRIYLCWRVRASHIHFCLKLFKLPLEKEGQVGGPILAQEEMKTIFGSIPDIYEVHTRIKVVCPLLFQSCYYGSILERSALTRCVCVWPFVPQSDLEELLTDWSEDRSVGDIILKYVSKISTRLWILNKCTFTFVEKAQTRVTSAALVSHSKSVWSKKKKKKSGILSRSGKAHLCQESSHFLFTRAA